MSVETSLTYLQAKPSPPKGQGCYPAFFPWPFHFPSLAVSFVSNIRVGDHCLSISSLALGQLLFMEEWRRGELPGSAQSCGQVYRDYLLALECQVWSSVMEISLRSTQTKLSCWPRRDITAPILLITSRCFGQTIRKGGSRVFPTLPWVGYIYTDKLSLSIGNCGKQVLCSLSSRKNGFHLCNSL